MADLQHSSTTGVAVGVRQLSPGMADGVRAVTEVVEHDLALPAQDKLLFMAAAAAARGYDDVLNRLWARAAHDDGSASDCRGVALALLNSRGPHVFELFVSTWIRAQLSCGDADGASAHEDPAEILEELRAEPGYPSAFVELAATLLDVAPSGLRGYALMREAALLKNPLGSKRTDLLLCCLNAADLQPDLVAVHAARARSAGATRAELVEAIFSAVPIVGFSAWFSAAPRVLCGSSR